MITAEEAKTMSIKYKTRDKYCEKVQNNLDVMFTHIETNAKRGADGIFYPIEDVVSPRLTAVALREFGYLVVIEDKRFKIYWNK